MKTVYIIRHGESETNTGGIRLGSATPLTESGRKQADLVAERVTRLPFEVIVSSTMERARETARKIAERTGRPIEFSDLFVERRWPSWYTGRIGDDPKIEAANKKMTENFTVPGYRLDDEENFDELKRRALAALLYLKERTEDNIVVVGHGLFLRVMLAAVIYGEELSAHECGRILGGMKTENTGISVIVEDNNWISGWKLFIFNDHAHLAD